MTFEVAVMRCLRRYASFEGRATRSEFWWFQLFTVLMVLVALMLEGLLDWPALFLVPVVALALPNIAAGVRRLHDAGLSGWWWWVQLLPFGGVVLLVMLVLGSDPRPNRYGPPPGAAGDGDRPAPAMGTAAPRVPDAPPAAADALRPTRVPPVPRPRPPRPGG